MPTSEVKWWRWLFPALGALALFYLAWNDPATRSGGADPVEYYAVAALLAMIAAQELRGVSKEAKDWLWYALMAVVWVDFLGQSRQSLEEPVAQWTLLATLGALLLVTVAWKLLRTGDGRRRPG
jgi:hypothetical protein